MSERPITLLALDLSLTRTGFARGVTDERPSVGTIEPKTKGEERLLSIRNRVLELAGGFARRGRRLPP